MISPVRFISAAFLLFSWALCSPSFAGKYNAVLSLGDPMPSFEDLPATDGTRLSSADIKESVVVLVSLANHCPWVQGMDQGLVDLSQDLKGKDVRVVGFAVNHKQEDRLPAMKEHAKKVGYAFTYVYDESQDLGRQLGATTTPEYFVFDKARKLVYSGLLTDSPARMTPDGSIKHINGEPTTHYVKDAVEAVLAGRAVAVPETRSHGCSVKYLPLKS